MLFKVFKPHPPDHGLGALRRAALQALTFSRLASPPGETAPLFDTALAQLERGDWPGAFEQMAALADKGHAPAARIALLMAARGTALFGGIFEATSAQRLRWLNTSRADGPADGAASN
jgi:hypothetical protein